MVVLPMGERRGGRTGRDQAHVVRIANRAAGCKRFVPPVIHWDWHRWYDASCQGKAGAACDRAVVISATIAALRTLELPRSLAERPRLIDTEPGYGIPALFFEGRIETVDRREAPEITLAILPLLDTASAPLRLLAEC